MYQLTLGAVAVSLIVAGGACARHSSKAKDVALGSRMHWEGTIQPMQQRTGAAAQSFPAAQYQGSVTMENAGTGMSRTSIHIRLSTPDNGGSVSWLLAGGRCGNVMNPVLPITSFDPLDVGSNGSVEETTEIPFEFPTDGSFHIDFFAGHMARLTEVIACANLALKGS